MHGTGFRTTGDQIANSVPADLSAPEVWDAIPEAAKFQIVTFVGVMELWRENKVVLESEGEKHYMRGGSAFATVESRSPLILPFCRAALLDG